jgi:hypothetical protein
MANLDQYRHAIQEVIRRHGSWHQHRRKYGCLIHMDIKEGKIWIQHDGTERGVANELVELGVPKEHIVLAYQPPYKRPYTAFAVA